MTCGRANRKFDFGNMFENLQKFIDEGLLESKKIVLFGAADPGIALKEYLDERGYHIYSVIDNGSKKQGMCFEGICVQKPEEVLGQFNPDFVILIASSHIAEMTSALEKMGYIKGEHILGLIDYEKILNQIKNSIQDSKKLTFKEVQLEEFHILQYIKEVCKENNLTYFLSSGTLLGAVRHKGFIPWDDDVDICMPCTDYHKFLQIVEQEGRFGVDNYKSNHFLIRYGYSRIFHKEIYRRHLGFPLIIDTRLCVDVFPLYSIPDDDAHAEKMFIKSRKLKNILRNASLYKPSKEFISAADVLVEMWEEISYKPSKRVMRDCVESPGYYEEEIVSYEAYEKAIEKEFCGEMFSVPVGYDEILRTLYKDYMALPPEEKRIPQNNYFFYR